jgi:hypothetical protein
MLSDEIRRLLAQAIISWSGPRDTARRIGEHLAACAKGLAPGSQMPPSLSILLQHPTSFNLVVLDAVTAYFDGQLGESDDYETNLAALSILVARLGGVESRKIVLRSVASALYSTPNIAEQLPETIDNAAHVSTGMLTREDEWVVVPSEEDRQIDGHVFIACDATKTAYDAFRRAEDLVSEMAQTDPAFASACDSAQRLERDWRCLLIALSELRARTPVGRHLKMDLQVYLSKQEPIGMRQDPDLIRLADSCCRDYQLSRRGDHSPGTKG